MVVATIVASVGVHLVLWPVGNEVITRGWSSTPVPPVADLMDDLMEVSLVPPPEDELRELPGRLVSPDRVLDERPPERPTDRISEFDSRVEHETRAPSRKPVPTYDPHAMGEQAGVSSRARPASEGAPVPPHALPLGRPTDGTSPEEGHSPDGDLPEDDLGAARGGEVARAPRPNLRGSADAMRKTFGGSASMDGLDDVEEGTESLLDSHRFRFASFFNRMRDQLAQHWDPNGAMARADPDGRTYGRRTRKTLLHVKLTPKGAISKIDVRSSSHVTELDKEAIRAFHQAAPFVNPPPEMIDAGTGFIEVDFLFVLEDGKTSIHRYLR